MATTNLGRVRFRLRGDYNPAADPLYSLLDLERIRKLQAENARLRALVGEPAPVEDIESEMGEVESAPTLVEKTDLLEENLSLLAEVIAL